MATSTDNTSARIRHGDLPPAATPKAYRAAIGDEIERLIAHLDALDGDPDLEETGDLEPSLGAYRVACDLELDTSDDEPSLGSLAGTAPFHLGTMANWTSQTNWAGGSVSDFELDLCDDEDSHDREASDLAGCVTDLEHDSSETGIGDEDGLEEQTGCFEQNPGEPQHAAWQSYDAKRANRAARCKVEQQAWTIAARINGGAPCNLRVVRL